MTIPHATKIEVKLEATGDHIETVVEVWVSIPVAPIQDGFDNEKYGELTAALDDIIADDSVDRVVVHSKPPKEGVAPQFGKY